jgi:hypothetical protein
VGPSQRLSKCVALQGAGPIRGWPRARRRLCLLKGCERPFVPSHPQARYCGTSCQAAACRWRRWRASRTYRGSDQGQARRREQSRQYRQRLRQQQVERQVEPPSVPQEELAAPREGQRAGPDSEKSCCARPGCYERFVRCDRSPLQQCCGRLCRQALRRVRQREARWRRRLSELLERAFRPSPGARGSPFV